MKPTFAELRADRVADATRRLVAEHDCRQHVAAAGASSLGEGETCRGQRRTAMDDGAQIAIVGSSGVAHHGVDLRRLGGREFGPGIKPQRGLRRAAALAGKLAEDPVETISFPKAALASVLAINIAACAVVCGGSSR